MCVKYPLISVFSIFFFLLTSRIEVVKISSLIFGTHSQKSVYLGGIFLTIIVECCSNWRDFRLHMDCTTRLSEISMGG